MGRRRNQRRAAARAAARAEKRSTKLRNTGPDETGNYGVNPWSARGHVVEVASKELRSNPNSTQFPKRIATQRMYDRYFKAGHLDEREWKAADALWRIWNAASLEAKVTSGYEPVTTHGLANQDHKIAKRVDGATRFVELMAHVPYRSRGVVQAVVVLDWAASQWAYGRGYGRRDSERHGLARLRPGLQALAQFLGY